MGYHMAEHLQRFEESQEDGDGGAVYVYNRTEAVSRRHCKEFGTTYCPTVSDLASRCDIIFMCLPTSFVVKDVVESMQKCLTSGSILVDCTSGDPAVTAKIAEALAQRKIEVVDAPVSGGPRGAKAGTLTVMMGGTPASVRVIGKIVAGSFGRVVKHVGAVGAGHATKAVNNALNATHLCAATEGLIKLKQKYHVLPNQALGVLNKSSGRSLQTEARIPEQVCTGKFSYGFKLGLMLKDVRIACGVVSSAAEDAGAVETHFDRTEKLLAEAVKRYGKDADYTRVCCVLEERYGVTLREENERSGTKKTKATIKIVSDFA